MFENIFYTYIIAYHFYLFLLVFSRSHRCRKYKNNRLICAAVDWLMYEQCWQCPDHHDSVAEVPSISLKSSSSYEVEWKINKDDEDESKVQWQKNEMEHNEVEKYIFREAQQVIHVCCRFWNIGKLEKRLFTLPSHWLVTAGLSSATAEL